jgi:riboflavin biosynthesis pyrimidine reductase
MDSKTLLEVLDPMDRPKVVILQTASADGRLAVSKNKPLLYGDERWQALEQIEGFNIFDWLREHHQTRTTLEGSNSFVSKGMPGKPLPPFEGDSAPLYQDFLPQSILERTGHRGWFTAVDGRGRIRWMYKDGYPGEPGWEGVHALVWAHRNTPTEYLAYLQRETIPYLIAGEGPVDLQLALTKMKSELRIECIISTAGGILNGALLRAGLVDEINLDILPAVIGGSDVPTLFAGKTLKEDEWPVPLKLLSSQVEDSGRIWLRYEVVLN